MIQNVTSKEGREWKTSDQIFMVNVFKRNFCPIRADVFFLISDSYQIIPTFIIKNFICCHHYFYKYRLLQKDLPICVTAMKRKRRQHIKDILIFEEYLLCCYDILRFALVEVFHPSADHIDLNVNNFLCYCCLQVLQISWTVFVDSWFDVYPHEKIAREQVQRMWRSANVTS